MATAVTVFHSSYINNVYIYSVQPTVRNRPDTHTGYYYWMNGLIPAVRRLLQSESVALSLAAVFGEAAVLAVPPSVRCREWAEFESRVRQWQLSTVSLVTR